MRLPILPADTRFGFYEFNRRAGDFALAMALVTYRVEDGMISRRRASRSAASSRSRAASRKPNRRLPAVAPDRAAFEAAAAAVAAAVDPLDDATTSASYRRDLRQTVTRRALEQRGGMIEKREITLTINGRSHGVRIDPRRTLVDAIRDDCGQTGTHIGCEHGVCGACTVLVDGEPVRSCLMFAVQADGRQSAPSKAWRTVPRCTRCSRRSSRHHGLQCGFCTPGFLMLATGVLEREPDISDEDLHRCPVVQSLPLHRL